MPPYATQLLISLMCIFYPTHTTHCNISERCASTSTPEPILGMRYLYVTAVFVDL